MKPHLYPSPWLPRIMFLHICTILTVQAVVPGLTSTPKTIKAPLLDVPKPSCSGVPDDFCKNNGTCREPRDDELWECSGDAGIGPLKCDCPTGFTGSRCETKLSCADLSCKRGEICDFNWSKQQLECIPLNTSGQIPTCKPGIHDIEFKYDRVNIQKSIICFSMYEFNSSSMCSDPDDSLTYLIAQGPPELPDLFCLVVDYQYYQTCLRVNATHRDKITMTDARVDVFAEEYSILERKARLQLNIIFNKPPVVSKPIVSWVVNSAELIPFNVISEAGVTSSFELTPHVVATTGSTALVASVNRTGQLELTPVTSILDLKRLQVIVWVTDDGIPSLSSNITVQVTVATLDCQTQGQITVDIRDLNSLTSSTSPITIGQIDCTSSTGYQLDYKLLNNPFRGLTVSVLEGDIQLSRNGDIPISSQTQSVETTISMQRFPRVTSDVIFNIQIGYLSLVWFKLTGITWNKEYINKNSNSYKTLKQSVETEIAKFINNTRVEVNIIQFRPDFWVDVLLESANEDQLDQNSKLVVDEARTGLIGNLKINSKAVFNVTGSSHLFKPEVNFVTNFDTSIYFLEETRVVVVCSVDYINHPTGDVDVDWTLDGATIRPLGNSRFQVSTQQTLPWRITSTLTINNVQTTDTGELACRARDVAGGITETETRLEVLSPPVIRIVPNTPTIFVQTGTEITLTCDVATPGVKTNFTWQNSADQTVTAGQTITQTIREDTSLTCNGTNQAGQGQPKTTKILIIPGEVTCPTESDSRNTPWLQTTPGFTAELPCPTGYTGIATRVCDSEGQWEEPNYDSCVQDKVVEIQNTIAKLESGIFVAEPEELVANLTDIAERPLERNEIITMTRAISKLTTIKSNINSTRRQENTKQFAMQSINLVGNLVDSKHNLTGVDSENTSVSLLLLDTMDEVSSLWGNSLPEGSSGTITTKNIVCTVGKTDPFNISDVIYPANESSSGASAVLPSSIFRSDSEFEPIVFSLITYQNLSSLPVTVNNNLTGNDTESKSTFEINSDVLTINIFPGAAEFDSSKLKSDFIFTLSHINKSLKSATCSYWDIQEENWDNGGCVVISTNQTSTTCSCNHLTNFALLMKPTSTNIDEKHISTLSTITLIGCTISIFCLLLTVLTYAFVWRYVKSDRAILLINLCIALMIALVIFLFGVDETSNQDVCKAIAIGLHYFYLVVFFLMLSEGVEVLVSIVKVFSSRSKLRELLVIGWGVPVIVVSISMGVTRLEGYGNQDFCWLSVNSGLIWAFIAPALLVIVINFIIVVKITHALLQTRVMINKDVRIRAKAALRSICILLPIVGVSWIFGILAVNEDLIAFDYIFTVLNTLQGLFIFIFHCIINRKVRDGLANRRRRYRSRHTDLSAPNTDSKRRKSSNDNGALVSLRDAKLSDAAKRRKSSNDNEVLAPLKEGNTNRGFEITQYVMDDFPRKRPIERLRYGVNYPRPLPGYLDTCPEISEGYSTLSGGDDPSPIMPQTGFTKHELNQEFFRPALTRGYSGVSAATYSDRSGSLNSDDLSVFTGLPRPRIRPYT